MNKVNLAAAIEEAKATRNKRKANRIVAPEILKANGVDHLITRRDGSQIVADNRVLFYPGTGSWVDLRSGEKGRGIFGMISHLKSVRRMEASRLPPDEHSRSST